MGDKVIRAFPVTLLQRELVPPCGLRRVAAWVQLAGANRSSLSNDLLTTSRHVASQVAQRPNSVTE
jgi:hypothetical protein